MTQGDLLHRHRRRRCVAAAGVVGLTLGAGGAGVYLTWPDIEPVRPAAGVDEGHGRGMSQLGAFDKSQQGMNALGIMQYYYPGAQLTSIAPTMVKVRLMGDDNETLDVYSDSGLTIGDQHVVPGQVAHLTPTPGGANVTITTGCSGDVLWRGATNDPWAHPVDPGPDRPAAEHLKICGGGGYRGALGVALEGDQMRTVDQVDTEDYLRGVVPTEMSANWADQGGVEALRAQAIAARTYALSETRYAYAQTCDTQDCQAYSGTDKEDARSDAAVRDTAGQVLLRDGHLLHTEYSSAPSGGKPGDIMAMTLGPSPDQLIPDITAKPAEPQPIPPAPSAIDTKYAETGGSTGALGDPLGPESALSGQAGSFRLFRNGVIVATPTLGTQVVDFATLLRIAPNATQSAPGTAGTPTPPPTPIPPPVEVSTDQPPGAPPPVLAAPSPDQPPILADPTPAPEPGSDTSPQAAPAPVADPDPAVASNPALPGDPTSGDPVG